MKIFFLLLVYLFIPAYAIPFCFLSSYCIDTFNETWRKVLYSFFYIIFIILYFLLFLGFGESVRSGFIDSILNLILF